MASYGLPYMGSKNKICKWLRDNLPSGKRFVDLFGGGGAVTHYMRLSGKYEEGYYNEINPLVCDFLKRAINGEFNYEHWTPEWISREDFHRLKHTDGYVKYVWSFGDNGLDYLWGKDIEEEKRQAFLYITSEGAEKINERRLNTGRVRSLEKLTRVQSLEKLTRVQINNGNYLDYSHKDGDIVYCDPPYENTRQYDAKKLNTFDSEQFYEWVYTRDYPVWFSSYEISDNRFPVVAKKLRKSTMSATRNNLARIETLYCNTAALLR